MFIVILPELHHLLQYLPCPLKCMCIPFHLIGFSELHAPYRNVWQELFIVVLQEQHFYRHYYSTVVWISVSIYQSFISQLSLVIEMKENNNNKNILTICSLSLRQIPD